MKLWWGIGLVAFGLIGAVVMFSLGWDDRSSDRGSFFGGPTQIEEGDFDSLGEQIYLTGRDENGRRIPRSGGFGGMMGMGGTGGCVDCHGTDGRGREIRMMMSNIDAPDIRWSVLSEPEEEAEAGEDGHEEEAEAGEHGHEPYDEESLARVLRDGEEPDGEELESVMPRWRVSERQVEALVDYLQELSD